MARQFLESSVVQAELHLLEKESPISKLMYFITEYALPAKIIAQCAGISPQAIYQYGEVGEASPRPSIKSSERIEAVAARLSSLAAEGMLSIAGSPKERNDALVSMLTVDPSA